MALYAKVTIENRKPGTVTVVQLLICIWFHARTESCLTVRSHLLFDMSQQLTRSIHRLLDFHALIVEVSPRDKVSYAADSEYCPSISSKGIVSSGWSDSDVWSPLP